MFTRTIPVYISKRFMFWGFCLLLFGATILFVSDLLELVRRTRDFDGYEFSNVSLIAILRLPSLLKQLFPFIALLAGVITFLSLNRYHELMMVKAAGLSDWQIIRPIFIITLMFGIIGVITFNPISMHLKRVSDETGKHLFALTGTTLLSTQENIWIRLDGKDGEFIFFANSTNSDRTEFFDVSISFLDNKSKLGERVFARKAVLNQNVWELFDAKTFNADSKPKDFPKVNISTFLTQEEISERIAEPESVSFWNLPSIIRLTEKAGLPAYSYTLQFHTILLLPLLLTSMVLIAASVAISYSKMVGPGRIFIIGILAGFLLYFNDSIHKEFRWGRHVTTFCSCLVSRINRFNGWNIYSVIQRGWLMIYHNQYLNRILEYISSIVSLLKYCINIEILLLTSFLMGAISLISVTYANQHEEFEFQFNVEAFEREMLLEADDEITFDVNGNITAIGNVQIRYDLYTLRANKVYFNRVDSTVIAENNVRILDRNGNIIVADKIELSEDFKNGVFHALNIETIQRILVRSQEAERKDGKLTTLKDGLYSPYLSQPEDFPPPWRISATEIILDHEADTVSFIAPRVEIFGLPLGVLPNFTVADPLLPRYTGFLRPTFISDIKLGYGVTIPYYIDLKPNLDMTVSAAPLTNQGLLMSGEFRHRLEKGTYSIRGSGISQLNPDIFVTSDGFKQVGNRQYRGAVNINGHYGINNLWSWGWDFNSYSDKNFVHDYGVTTLGGYSDTQRVWLNGISGRNLFQANFLQFEVFGDHPKDRIPKESSMELNKSLSNCQPRCDVPDPSEKQAKVHPMIDYQYFLKNSIFGGELSFGSNIISVSREKSTDYFKISENEIFNSNKKFFRGIKGNYSRSTAYLNWKRNMFTPYGHVLTPFLDFQGDFFVLRELDPDVEDLASDNIAVRGLPSVGLKYRFPLIDSYFWGSQVIEPIAQLVIRPDERRIGEIPNEDAQSLVFDASTLFETNKFSGFDRTEGGIRANLGINQLLQFNNGGSINSLIGQSFHLLGNNSFDNENSDIVNSAGESGLEDNISDYVGSIYLDSNIGFRIGTNARLDQKEFNFNRLEVESAGLLGPISASLNYAYLKARPLQGVEEDRQEIIGATNIRLFDKFRIFGSTRYDLKNDNFVKNVAGFGYDDEGFSFSLTFSEDRTRIEGKAVNRRLWFRFGFRTLGDTGFSLAFDPESE